MVPFAGHNEVSKKCTIMNLGQHTEYFHGEFFHT